MPDPSSIAVFDIGGTWFRWGLYSPAEGLLHAHRVPAINYLSHPAASADELQSALARFLVDRVQARRASISLGAPINANNRTVLGSGPLWGSKAKPFRLHEALQVLQPDVEWHVFNDVTALLAPYMEDESTCRKTLLITVSSGIGSRLYDHRARRIPYDETHGVQGEIGHLVYPFLLEGHLVNLQCECGGWSHINAFASGRGIARVLRDLPLLCPSRSSLFEGVVDLAAFQALIEREHDGARRLLEAFVTPLSRILAASLCLDPEIDRIVLTGGVIQGLGRPYRDALERVFLRDGLYQITERDPDYLARRLLWADQDDFSGLRGAGLLAEKIRM
jgi:2-epi-5-epi-valiolone 7-kinase